MAKLIVPRAFGSVRQDTERLGRFLELGRRRGIVRVAVGMELHRAPAVRFFEFRVARAPFDAEQLVVVHVGSFS